MKELFGRKLKYGDLVIGYSHRILMGIYIAGNRGIWYDGENIIKTKSKTGYLIENPNEGEQKIYDMLMAKLTPLPSNSILEGHIYLDKLDKRWLFIGYGKFFYEKLVDGVAQETEGGVGFLYCPIDEPQAFFKKPPESVRSCTTKKPLYEDTGESITIPTKMDWNKKCGNTEIRLWIEVMK